MTEPAEQARQKTVRAILSYRMIWRWHFYAGLFCVPFIILLAMTGTTYLFKPQIEAALEAGYNNLAFEGAPRPVAEQVYVAMHALHGADLKQVEIRDNPHDALRVTMNDAGTLYRVFVHPQSLEVLKILPEKARFMEVIKTIHGELAIGKGGELIVELAASWAIVMIITGLYLWWPRSANGLAGVLWPRVTSGPRLFWRDLHAVTGIYVSAFALVLLLSGLPWTGVWGAGFRAIVAATKPVSAPHEWTGSRAEEKQQLADEHSHHDGASGPMGADMGTDLTGLDGLLPAVRDLDLPPPVLLKPAGPLLWQASTGSQNRTAQHMVTYSAQTGEVVNEAHFADKPLIDRIVSIGISAHEGHLFGGFNQALGVLTALGLVTLCVSATVMWWSKRPADKLGAPPKKEERPGIGLIAIIVALSIFLPVLGASLIIVALIERLVLRRIPAARDWLGLA